jgi:hypothetical protein
MVAVHGSTIGTSEHNKCCQVQQCSNVLQTVCRASIQLSMRGCDPFYASTMRLAGWSEDRRSVKHLALPVVGSTRTTRRVPRRFV